jgi:hypothetical protein
MESKITSPKLNKLINEVRILLIEQPANLPAIKSSLETLLLFLTSPTGLTDQNCRETDLFFCLNEENGFSWKHLPEEYQLIFDDIGMQLHDTIKTPEIAKKFDSTPEQLLARIRMLK